MSLTSIARIAFLKRQRELQKHIHGAEELQQQVLARLVDEAKDTEYGRNHLYSMTRTYDDFARNVPVNTYEELKGDIDRMRHGERDVLWPGTVKWYAKSSGTTNDKSKFIPVSDEGLHNIHYAGGRDCVALYLRNNPKSRMFDGKGLILGGSHSPNYNVSGSLVGDLSAILIENINPLVNLVRVPKKQTALLSDFEVKRDRIAHETLNKNVTNLSGVPSWMLSVLVRVMELTGKQHLEEVWPNLEVFFHGGIAFTPYRKQYERLITKSDMHYMETYNASEGFFGLQNDPTDSAMLLMLDYDVFYEFIPMDEFGTDSPTVVPLWGIETGKNYAMLISTSCGLWRYMIGDTVMFTQKDPGPHQELHQRLRRRTHRRQCRERTCIRLSADRCRSAGIHGSTRLHGRQRQVSPPVAHRVQQATRRRAAVCPTARQEVAGNQQRLRGQALQGHHPAAPRNSGGTPRTLQRLAQE